MVTSIPMESIPRLTIHQIEAFFPLDESEKELMISVIGGGNSTS